MLFLILVVLVVLLWIKKVNDNHKKMKCFVSPPGRLIFKHLHLLENKTLLKNFMDLTNEYGGLLRLTLLYGKDSLVIADKDFLSFLLTSPNALNKNEIYRHSRKWLGNGLLTSEREKWEKQRKQLTPAFRVQVLENYIQTFHAATDIMLDKLRNEAKDECIDIFSYIKLCALDIVCETAMGTKIHAQEKKHSSYVRNIKEECQILIDRFQSIPKSIDIIYVFFQDYWRERKILKVLHDFTKEVVNKRKDELLADPKMQKRKEETKNLSFLDLLLEYNSVDNRLSVQEIAEQVDTFMFAGHDTSATGASFTLYCLAKHPQIQQKVLEEQQLIFNSDNRMPTYKDLQDMKYLDMVIKESLRLYPPVPLIGRQAECDIKYGESVIPKDMSIVVFIYGVHRNPLYFENPDEFIPERFESNIEPFTYVPFSAGVRNCIGQRFAIIEIKYLVTRILREFELRCDPDFVPQLLPLIVLTSLNGIMIKLNGRSK